MHPHRRRAGAGAGIQYPDADHHHALRRARANAQRGDDVHHDLHAGTAARPTAGTQPAAAGDHGCARHAHPGPKAAIPGVE